MERPMTAPALKFRNLTLGYDRHPAVHHLDGTVASGALIAVVGPNGAGKSTLFKGIAGLLRPLAGAIERGGLSAQDIASLQQTMLEGDVAANLIRNDRKVGIRVRYPLAYRDSIEKLNASLLTSPTGVTAPLSRASKLAASSECAIAKSSAWMMRSFVSAG